MVSESKTARGLITQLHGDSFPTSTAAVPPTQQKYHWVPQKNIHNLQIQSSPYLPHFSWREGNNISSQVARGDRAPALVPITAIRALLMGDCYEAMGRAAIQRPEVTGTLMKEARDNQLRWSSSLSETARLSLVVQQFTYVCDEPKQWNPTLRYAALPEHDCCWFPEQQPRSHRKPQRDRPVLPTRSRARSEPFR